MPTAPRLTIGILTGLLVGPVFADESVASAARLAVGATGITCVKEPCPWRGIVELDNERRDPLRPDWSGERLPKLEADPQDAARIEAAWEAMECLEIEGTVTDDPDSGGSPLLRVERIVGACP